MKRIIRRLVSVVFVTVYCTVLVPVQNIARKYQRPSRGATRPRRDRVNTKYRINIQIKRPKFIKFESI